MATETKLENYTITESFFVPVPESPSYNNNDNENDNYINLHGKSWIPNINNGKGPFPVLLELLPYRHADGTLYRDCINYDYFASHGIACIRVDMRGCGNSDSYIYGEYLSIEQYDSYNILKWLYNRKWCNKHIFLWGKSWGGINAVQVAQYDYNMSLKNNNNGKRLLSGIISLHFSEDRYNRDVHYMGGCLMSENLLWATCMAVTLCKPPVLFKNKKYKYKDDDAVSKWENELLPFWKKRLKNTLEKTGSWAHEWTKHSTNDLFWKHGSIKYSENSFLQNGFPCIFVGGMLDNYHSAVNHSLNLCNKFNDSNGNSNKHGIIGVWEHQFPNLSMVGPRLPFLKIVRRFIMKHSNMIENDNDNDDDSDSINSNDDKRKYDLPYFLAFLHNHICTQREFKNEEDISGTWIKFDTRTQLDNARKSISFDLELRSNYYNDEFVKGKGENEVIVSNSLLVGKNHQRFFPSRSAMELVPVSQNWDDYYSTCLKTNTFNNDANVVGLPKVKLSIKLNELPINKNDETIVSDGYNIVIRICIVNSKDGTNDGSVSKLLSWKSYDLKQLGFESNLNEFTEIELELPSFYYKIKKNSWFYVTISNNYWPMIWPNNNNNLKYKVNINDTQLILPIINQKDIKPHMINDNDPLVKNMPKMSPQQDIIANNFEEVREGSMKRLFEYGSESSNEDSEGCNDNDNDNESENNDSIRMDYAIRDDGHSIIKDREWIVNDCGCNEKWSIDVNDVLSAKHDISKSVIIRKDGIFESKIYKQSIMTCDEKYFYLKSILKVSYNNNEYIINKEFNKKILRKCQMEHAATAKEEFNKMSRISKMDIIKLAMNENSKNSLNSNISHSSINSISTNGSMYEIGISDEIEEKTDETDENSENNENDENDEYDESDASCQTFSDFTKNNDNGEIETNTKNNDENDDTTDGMIEYLKNLFGCF